MEQPMPTNEQGSDPALQNRCEWRAAGECQFGSNPTVPFAGREYCIYHLPLEAEGKPTDAAVYHSLLKKYLDVCGTQFPAGTYEVPALGGHRLFEGCMFAGKVRLKLGSEKTSFDCSTFLGSVTIRSDNSHVSLRGIKCHGELTVQASDALSARSWTIEESTFHDEVDFSNV
jgi:hypothetical protein